MKASTCVSFLLLLVIHGSLQESAPSSPTYRAAVVELNPVHYEFDPERTLNENGATTVSYIERAAEKNAEIVVFPELGLSTFEHSSRNNLIPFSSEIPAPSQRYAACDSNDTSVREAVRMVACAAERNKIYVVINLLEVKYCSGNDCNPDGFFIYITSVVFDRNGIIISRYRKSYLHDEYGFYDYLASPEIVTFTTDFGVTFGHIICYDILFKNPWIDVARKLNVTDFIFVTALNPNVPFTTPLQVQAGWSYAEDVNLLAANYNMERFGHTGSGIYAGRDGILTAIMTQGSHKEMLVADVPKKFGKAARPPTLSRDPEGHVRLIVGENQGYRIRNALIRKNESAPRNSDYVALKHHVTKLISHNGYLFEEMSHNGIRCQFEVDVTNLSPPATYRLIAFADPFQDTKMVTLGLRICSIVSCVNETLNSCGLIHNSSTVFRSIAVTATYEYSEHTIMTPNSLGSDLFPLRSWVFDSRREGDQEHTFMFLPKPVQGLITFGVWGRDFDEDVINPLNSETRIFSILIGVTILVILFGKRSVYFS